MRLPGLKYDSPYDFTRKQRWILRLAPPLLAGILKILFRSCRVECEGYEVLEERLHHSNHTILAIWHESMGLAGCFFQNTNYHTLTSYSFDGELAARVVARLGMEAVRGSSSRGGSNALQQLQNALELTPCVGFTLDGPRGPRRQAKAGIAILAARTDKPIIPIAFALKNAHRLHSWDRLPIPRPFSRIQIAFASPIPPPPNESPEAIEATRLEVETVLNQLQRELETRWNQPDPPV